MARDFIINGPVLVKVVGGAHLSGMALLSQSQLGMSTEAVRVTPNFVHRDILVDDYGPDVPADTMWQLADCRIRMALVHWDREVLDNCLTESMAGSHAANAVVAGVLSPAGTMMGGGKTLLASGCHYITLTLTSPTLGFPYRFPASYLTGPPMELPLGTEKSVVLLNWRSIPYRAPQTTIVGVSGSITSLGEIVSSGAVLWDHNADNI